jgi:alanine-glyoxylate transaminase / (R)-3-amino-2-methylpropionate-pyruvate transaminase
MTRDEILKKKDDYVFPCVTTYYKDHLVADHAKGHYLWDLEGKRYLDFFGGILTVSVGHCHPTVTGRIQAQAARLQHSSTLYPTEAM